MPLATRLLAAFVLALPALAAAQAGTPARTLREALAMPHPGEGR